MMITIRMVFPIPARKPRASSCAASRPTSVATRDMAYDYKPSRPAMGLTGWRDGRALSPDRSCCWLPGCGSADLRWKELSPWVWVR